MSQFTVQITGKIDISVVFTEMCDITVAVGPGGSVTVGDVTVGPASSEVFRVPVGSSFTFQVNPLPDHDVAVIANGEVIQPDA